MIHCKNCGSTNVKIYDLNFAKLKPEGRPAAKLAEDNYSFFCNSCQHSWEYDPNAKRIYDEYLVLRNRTELVVHDMKNGHYEPGRDVALEDLTKRHEKAKLLKELYGHILDLSPGEWYEIELDLN